MDQILKLGKWGNSNAIRLPKGMLEKVGITPNDKEVSVNVTTDSIVIKPKRKEKLLDKLFENYDSNQPYPFEIVDKGGAVGEELY
ncbi:AbrB/MazE/SpoVT family DNA-binding domain-containing protein [Limosilactobacillus reuteri]|uniref:AbrB/MazE/SpoVT family DNA-binding domain-containing protein n=1 Tax=Limosilactobacillus reuteri TaxID=1598 RepID=A0ABD6Y7C1_LIMRT|nr:AbrB/MazE/SpoVT family DNA-binding domain-containing protein [Limosilactobacillus reuteri]MCC4343537.1 AbrB/MazE/SpoVT family DNA-binding domain-containing protein [Limosilactobacillus reuteri]MCC4356158.1 AbrB/MazE/SpoVT family DNA-binding domain-containing protein [Limosilactobacillus reuteri]MCT3208041.1 AbrB/MazE/SpoVT family DNA-binding domain-containing protein [Limosilactobacillus reuteri]MCT3217213.1 AbrB/MazE/SpoVT family DNA-binding domain-containing protein [Limosilactobacillus re